MALVYAYVDTAFTYLFADTALIYFVCWHSPRYTLLTRHNISYCSYS